MKKSSQYVLFEPQDVSPPCERSLVLG